jgi:hypothetical protein
VDALASTTPIALPAEKHIIASGVTILELVKRKMLQEVPLPTA